MPQRPRQRRQLSGGAALTCNVCGEGLTVDIGVHNWTRRVVAFIDEHTARHDAPDVSIELPSGIRLPER
jgi:hypothetical protein